MTTIWGDEGNECDLYSALPGMLYQAESAYTRADEVDAELLRRKFDGIVGADLDDWVYASKLECVARSLFLLVPKLDWRLTSSLPLFLPLTLLPRLSLSLACSDTQAESQPISVNSHYTPNLAKFLLWEEPFFSFLSPQYRGYDLETHVRQLRSRSRRRARRVMSLPVV